jgi:flagellin-like hook-associated protein FlgL
MADITLSSAVRNNLLALQNTAELLGKTQERLATGLKVNSALDDPTAFFTASSLNSRAGDLSRLLDSIGNAVQTVKAADEGISSITKLVETAQAAARQALSSAVGSATTSTAGTTSVNLTDELDATGLGITAGEQLTVTIGSTAFVIGFNNTGTAGAGEDVAIDLDGADDADGGGDDATVQDIVDALNTQFGAGTASVVSNAFTIAAANPADSITVGGTVATTLGLSSVTSGYSSARAALETEFNDLRTQIDQLAADSSFNGNNLLNGDSLSVIFNEDGSSTLSIAGVTFNSAGLGITAAGTDTFQTDTAINASLAELDTAIATLRTQASTFGSNLSVIEIRQDFTKNLINTLETGAANLTLADSNEEGANVLALQTRQQLSSVALSLASQADQNVLRLF